MSTNNNDSGQLTKDLQAFAAMPSEWCIETPRFLLITETKLKDWIRGNLRELERKRNSWRFPLGLLIPLALTYVTCNFKPYLGASSILWQYSWSAVIVLITVWVIVALVKRKRSTTVEEKIAILIQDLKVRRTIQ